MLFWIDSLERDGVDRIGSGAILLRKRSAGTNWARAVDLPLPFRTGSNDHVLRVFGGHDFVAAIPEELFVDHVYQVERRTIQEEVRYRPAGKCLAT